MSSADWQGRFWDKVDVRSREECWEWTGAKNRSGYGQIYFPKPMGQQGAHRASFFLEHGAWPNVCRHRCDNPGCVNPRHLEDGTHAENMKDRVRRKTGARGVKQGLAVLNEDAVRDIRNSEMTLPELASKHGCAVPTAWHVKKRNTWKHVE